MNELADVGAAGREQDQAKNLKPVRGLDYFLLGEELYKQGKPDQAVRAFDSALQKEPADFWSRYFLALSHLKLRRPLSPAEDRLALNEAKVALSICVGQRPAFLSIYLLRGFVYGELGDFEAAEADFRHAAQSLSDEMARYVFYTNRGALRYRQGMLDAAADDFKQAIGFRPGQFNVK
jgi:tetratricopeptide (TPR) repeat protein